MLSQLRAGGIELLAAPSLTLSTLVPLSGLPSIGFAFQSYDQIWAALDGGVGDVVRDAIGKAGIVPMKKIWDNGFRQITSSSSRQLDRSGRARINRRRPIFSSDVCHCERLRMPAA